MGGAAALYDWLAQVAGVRVVELPRRAPAKAEGRPIDLGQQQRLAAVTAIYHAAGADTGAPLALGWARNGATNAVHVFTAGGIIGAAGSDGRRPLSLPPGATGLAREGGALLRMLAAMPHWTRVSGIADGLLVEDGMYRPDDLRPTLDECLLRVWHAEFAWLLLAEPVPMAEIDAAARSVAADERDARTRAGSPEHAVRAERLALRHRELRQGESGGMWRVHLLAGAATPAGAAAVAGLLCASADLSRLPYALIPSGIVTDLASALDGSPLVASSALVAALAVTPVEEIPGVRLAVRSEFDVTPEMPAPTSPRPGSAAVGVRLGQVLDHDGRPGEDLHIGTASLNRHTFVSGATGAGKSQTVRHLLEETTRVGVPWLVVEPAKAEYRQMADRIGGERVIVIRPGDRDAPPAGFNPLEPAAADFPLQTHIDLARSLFLAAFDAEEPFPQVLSAALTRCYEDLGWDLVLGGPRVPGSRPRYPTLGDLQQTAELVVEQIGYGREVTDNVRGFIRVRLASLRLGTTGRFFEGGHPLSVQQLLAHNVVFEIEDVGDDRDKAFLMGGLLIQLVEHLRTIGRQQPDLSRLGLRHLSVFEEAHRLLRRAERAGPAAHAVELFAALLAEMRAYGEGLVIAEQIPSKLIADVIKNTAVKVMHRLPAEDDRKAVGATVNLTDPQSKFVVTLPPGTGAVFADGMDQPVLVRMPDGSSREQGGVTATAAVGPLIGRRSGTCGGTCAADACTLRDMRTAQLYLAEHPWLPLWAELAVLGHLTGWPVPALRAAHIRALLDLPDRLRECALSHAVDEAVAARSSVLSATAGPDRLGRHVLRALDGYLHGVVRCEDDETWSLAKPYRWARLWDDLRAADRAGATGRDPRSAEWAARYGRTVPGDDVSAQLAEVSRWFDADLRDPAVNRRVALGVHAPSALERSTAASSSPPAWRATRSSRPIPCPARRWA
ncbi:ATP-binding protein [Dactylosporangium sp. CS-047395]|uniref:ATP-binding protein n=1 Tax=Dactylosporangium sp. CS-047395 TaxID=3239936 RepID=UPI003D89E54B